LASPSLPAKSVEPNGHSMPSAGIDEAQSRHLEQQRKRLAIQRQIAQLQIELTDVEGPAEPAQTVVERI
jgi:hypothetical protein